MITHDVQVALLEDCREIAIENNYEIKSRIPLSDLLEYRSRIAEEHEKQKKSPFYHVLTLLGFRNQNEQLVRVLDRAVDLVAGTEQEDSYFHYMDFLVSAVLLLLNVLS